MEKKVNTEIVSLTKNESAIYQCIEKTHELEEFIINALLLHYQECQIDFGVEDENHIGHYIFNHIRGIYDELFDIFKDVSIEAITSGDRKRFMP